MLFIAKITIYKQNKQNLHIFSGARNNLKVLVNNYSF